MLVIDSLILTLLGPVLALVFATYFLWRTYLGERRILDVVIYMVTAIACLYLI